MTPLSKFLALIAWTAFVGVATFLVGVIATVNHYQLKEAKAETKALIKLARKSATATAVGIQTEKAQDKTDQTYQQIKSDYEADQQNNPAIGCVLDPVSLRRWNAANAGSDGATSGEPDDEVPTASTRESRPERGE